jgi:hypothetical protein
MTRTLSRSLLLSVAALALAACGGKAKPAAPPTEAGDTGGAATDDPPAETPPADRVCCESFGYGAQMVPCCQSYAWTTAAECTVPPGLVGGGKQVVADDKCGS